MTKKIKEFYQSKRGKAILFFGFYFIFFLILAICLRNNQINSNENNKPVEKQPSNYYNLNKIINSNYEYNFIVNDNNNVYHFHGTKKENDYDSFDNKYFFDLFNLNQLIKKSKLVKNENNLLTYELSNSTLNNLLMNNQEEGVNTIQVYVNDYSDVNRIVLDLKSFMQQEKYLLDLTFKVGDENG